MLRQTKGFVAMKRFGMCVALLFLILTPFINAQAQSAAEAWTVISPEMRSCVSIAAQKNNATLEGLIAAGVVPSDPRLVEVMKVCRQFVEGLKADTRLPTSAAEKQSPAPETGPFITVRIVKTADVGKNCQVVLGATNRWNKGLQTMVLKATAYDRENDYVQSYDYLFERLGKLGAETTFSWYYEKVSCSELRKITLEVDHFQFEETSYRNNPRLEGLLRTDIRSGIALEVR